MENNEWYRRESLPSNLSRYSPKPRVVTKADFYVSLSGKENACGSIDDPFATLSEARDAVREAKRNNPDKHFTVAVMPGIYNFSESFKLLPQDSDVTYSAYNNDPVVFCGGITVDNSDVVRSENGCFFVDLKKYGINGNFDNYDFFINGNRAVKTCYPHEDFLSTGEVIKTPDNDKAEGAFTIDQDTANYLKGLDDTGSVEMFGYFAVDWSASRVKITDIDTEKYQITARGFDFWGLKENCPYRFENIREELKYPNQYYIECDSSVMYFIPECGTDNLRLEISFLGVPFIEAETDNIEISGFDFSLSGGPGIIINGKNNRITQCRFERIGKLCIEGHGEGNKVSDCEFEHISGSCVTLYAGDRPTLTPGFAEVDNCLFHDFGETVVTGTHAVSINGVHNRISHCEIYNSPHTCIHYSGQDHLIEYNYAHNVVQQASDAGTTYSGYHWDSQGCILRYNCFCNIGNEKHPANGIYWDDMLSGQIGYGNIIINAAGNGFLIGGGRDHLNYNNVVINAGGYSLHYDSRGTTWESGAATDKSSGIWNNLKAVPYKSEQWQAKFPNLAKIDEDADMDNPNYAGNPSNSRFSGNVYISSNNCLIGDATRRFSYIGDNFCMDVDDDPGFVDRKNGNYTFREDSPVFVYLPGFENLPFEKIGRY